jgi:hypothetical protein
MNWDTVRLIVISNLDRCQGRRTCVRSTRVMCHSCVMCRRRLTSWQIDRLAGWQVGRLADWQVGRLADWQESHAPSAI